MKIRVAILEKDINYLNRIVSVFGTRYADKFELYSFTDKDVALSVLEESKIDVLVADDTFDIDVETLPKRCGFAYFVESADISMENDQLAICKFQKADLIYRQILSVYSEKAGSISGLRLDEDATKVIAFCPVSGGTGASTVAAAAARHYAQNGKRVFYLNIEKFGNTDIFFTGEGQFDMSDIIFALKSKKGNLQMKLESCVKQDACGVYFYSQPKVALDMMELGTEEIVRLISEIKLSGSYDYIVIDSDFELSKDAIAVYKTAHTVVWVGDGSELSNSKLQKAYAALSIMEAKADSPLTNRLNLIYNKFSNKTGLALEDIGIKNVGGAPRYEHATTKQVIEQLCEKDMFDKLG